RAGGGRVARWGAAGVSTRGRLPLAVRARSDAADQQPPPLPPLGIRVPSAPPAVQGERHRRRGGGARDLAAVSAVGVASPGGRAAAFAGSADEATGKQAWCARCGRSNSAPAGRAVGIGTPVCWPAASSSRTAPLPPSVGRVGGRRPGTGTVVEPRSAPATAWGVVTGDMVAGAGAAS